MNIYSLGRIGDCGYEEVIGFVIAAADEESARALPFVLHMADDPYGTEGCGIECHHEAECLADDDNPQTPCIWRDPVKTTCVMVGVASIGVVGVVQRSRASS